MLRNYIRSISSSKTAPSQSILSLPSCTQLIIPSPLLQFFVIAVVASCVMKAVSSICQYFMPSSVLELLELVEHWVVQVQRVSIQQQKYLKRLYSHQTMLYYHLCGWSTLWLSIRSGTSVQPPTIFPHLSNKSRSRATDNPEPLKSPAIDIFTEPTPFLNPPHQLRVISKWNTPTKDRIPREKNRRQNQEVSIIYTAGLSSMPQSSSQLTASVSD